MHRRFLIAASLLSCLAVILGAFGAHGLRKFVPLESLSAFETGVRYQFYHSIALLIAGFAGQWFSDRWTKYAGYFFIAGMVLFSGSLYALTLLKATNTVGLNGIGILTPIGGLFFIAGWLAMTRAFIARK